MKKSLILLLGLLLAFSMLLIAYLSFTPAELREVEHSQDSFHHNDEKKEKPLSGKITVLTNRVDLVADGTMQRYAVKFQEKHPHVQVEFEGLKNYMHDIRIRLTTGEAGDVLLIPEYVPNSEFKDYFEPLPDEMFEYVRFTDIMLHEGKRYGMATGVNTLGIVYNKKAFAKAGITSIPLTLDELFEAAHKLKGVGVIPLYSNYGAQWPLGVWGEHSVSWRSGDAEYLGKMVHEEEPFQLDNAWGQGISILRYFIEHELVEPDLLSNNWEKSKRQIANGEAAMYCLGSWVINQIIDAGAAPEEIGIFPLPYDNSGRLYAPMDLIG
ncbi:ABC transporter substrate-binding protein [Caldalkalibacillus mannanilyticus]|uniref:ABC transporter substrate-binding protein n=1 Tax=Caldalkalibacillus mannanilyticus TaxID=1418 RepID=UPI000B07B8AB|nr:extracellular solute-binding protein [Caldalkalibacillus mannanilyticus]